MQTAASVQDTQSPSQHDIPESMRHELVENNDDSADLHSLLETQLRSQKISKNKEQKITPEDAFIEGVPILEQLPDFPTGCESVSAVMLLQFAGVDISIDEFVDIHLEKQDAFYHRDGVCFGPDPYSVFIGNPRDDASYGCMSPVIEKAFLRVLGNADRIQNLSGMTLAEISSQYISRGIPVMVWTSMKMKPPRPGALWHLENGSSFQWLANEHCMVLLGYDAEYFYFNDPYEGETVSYPRIISEERYAAFEMQALAILPQ